MFPIQPMIFNNDNEYWVHLMYPGVILNRYLISSHGNIYDIITNSLIKVMPVTENNRYPTVYLLSEDGKSHRYLLHKLVANNFIFDGNLEHTVVNHLDGNKQNPHAINLEYTTSSENTRHAVANGLTKSTNSNKLTEDIVVRICQMLQDGLSYKEILLNIGLDYNRTNRELIANIYRKKSWRKISDEYTFPTDDRKLFYTHDSNSIKKICSMLQDGYDVKNIIESVFGIEYHGSRINKKEYELVRRIKSRELFTDISKDYNF